MTYEALSKAGVPLLAYGNFITVALNFAILALIIFMMVRLINQMKKAEPVVAAAPPATPEDVILLRQIRDSLAKH
jgi:large conductance mechanosensitive channel